MKRWPISWPISWPILTILALALVILVACGSTPQPTAPAEVSGAATAALPDTPKNSDGYVDISVADLAPALDNKNFTLVNVHIPYDGELPKTDLFIPFDQITTQLDRLPDKNALIVLYCRSGNMSTQAAKKLTAAGYTHVYELDGGTNAWQAAGYTLLSK